MTWAEAAEQRRPPQQSYPGRHRVSSPRVYRTASPCTPNGIPRCAGSVSCKRNLYRTLSWGVGSQTPGLVQSPSRCTQNVTPHQREMSVASDKLFSVKSVPSFSLSSARPLVPRPCEQPRFASPSSRHIRHTSNTVVSPSNRGADHVCQPTRTTARWASLMHVRAPGEDLVDWKILRRRDDIGALVEFLTLLRDRETRNRRRIEQEAISSLDALKHRERQERAMAPFSGLRLPIAQLKSLNSFGTSRANKNPQCFVQQEEILKGLAGHPLARQGEDKKRWDSRGVAVERQLLITDEETAARSLIELVEEGCRGRFMLAASGGTRGAGKKGGALIRIDDRVDEKKGNCPGKLEGDANMKEDAECKTCHDEGEARQMGDLWGPLDAQFEPLDGSVHGRGLGTTASDALLSLSNDRLFPDALGGLCLASANSAWGERDEEDDVPVVVSPLRRSRETHGEREGGMFPEKAGPDDVMQRLEQSDVETSFDSEHAWLEEAGVGLCHEEQEARAEIMQLEKYDMAQLEERRCNFWLSRHVVDAVSLQMENIIREEDSRRIYICGNFFLDAEASTDSNVASPRELLSPSPRRLRTGLEQRERDALCSAFCDGVRAVTEAAIAALLEQERDERARLEREAQPKYTAVLWGMVSMGERQEVLLEEQSAREGVEYDAMGHWMDLQLLHSFQQARLFAGTTGVTPRETESSCSSDDSKGNTYSLRPVDGGSNSSFCSLPSSRPTPLDGMDKSKTVLSCSASTDEDGGGPVGRGLHEAQSGPEAPQATGVAPAFLMLEAEERQAREALHADWHRGYENLIQLDDMATREFMRVIILFDRMRASHTPAIF